MVMSQAPWVSIKAADIQVDAAAIIDTSGTAPADMQQNGLDNPSGGECLILLVWIIFLKVQVSCSLGLDDPSGDGCLVLPVRTIFLKMSDLFSWSR